MPHAGRGILERLDAGEVIIGDGSYCRTLEQRGYVLAVDWTPEAVVKHPDAVYGLGKEFCRAGADITQTNTYYASGRNYRKGESDEVVERRRGATCAEINKKACEIANGLSKTWNTLVAGSVSQTESYERPETRSKQTVKEELTKAMTVLIDNHVDFILLEYFGHIEEMEWAIEFAQELYNKPIAASMCIGPKGDRVGVSTLECARRMIAAGADIVGVNCLFDPSQSLEAMVHFKRAIAELNPGVKRPHLMVQPNGYHTQDAGRCGWLNLDEFPLALEPRQITRWDAAKYAREAYEMGIRWIGGCCGFESYHIRAMAEELRNERGQLPVASLESDLDLKLNFQRSSDRGFRTEKWHPEFWMNMRPKDGRSPVINGYKA